MATTVTYKGATLTTVDNQTKVLQTAGTWVEDDFTLVDVSGGGSGAFTLLDEITLTENVRTAQVNFTASWLSSYDILIIILDGEQVSSDWIYWGVNENPNLSSNNYSTQHNPFKFPFIFTKAFDNSYAYMEWYGRFDQYFITSNGSNFANNWNTLSYIKWSGYSKDIKTGTKIRIYGANYADL